MKRDGMIKSAIVAAWGAACFLAAPADAERLVTSVSTHRVLINSNFSGSGDEINFYNTSGVVDTLTYGSSALSGATISRNILLANLGSNNAAASVASSVGDSFGSCLI